jgi:hypothetical protein
MPIKRIVGIVGASAIITTLGFGIGTTYKTLTETVTQDDIRGLVDKSGLSPKKKLGLLTTLDFMEKETAKGDENAKLLTKIYETKLVGKAIDSITNNENMIWAKLHPNCPAFNLSSNQVDKIKDVGYKNGYKTAVDSMTDILDSVKRNMGKKVDSVKTEGIKDTYLGFEAGKQAAKFEKHDTTPVIVKDTVYLSKQPDFLVGLSKFLKIKH